MSAEARIYAMVESTKRDQTSYRNKGKSVEAAACAIRITALIDALNALREDTPNER